MKLSSLLIWAAAAVGLLSSCGSDGDYQPAPLPSDTVGVYVPAQTTNFAYGNEGTLRVPVTMKRTGDGASLQLPLTYNFPVNALVYAPKSVTFLRGDSVAQFEVEILADSLESFKAYTLTVGFAGEGYDPYKRLDGPHKMAYTLIREQYDQQQPGTLTNLFPSRNDRAVVLESSKGNYIIRNAWGSQGVGHVRFKVNADNSLTFVDTNGFDTGIVDVNYGAVKTIPRKGVFDPAAGTYTFTFEYFSATANFGEYQARFTPAK